MPPLKEYQIQLKGHSYFFTIDPGARSNGGTGLAFWSITEEKPLETKQFGSIRGVTMHDLKVEHILHQIKYHISKFNKNQNFPVFIEEPKFFDSLKGVTAARSGALFKLVFFYGRLFQLVQELGLKPIPMEISHWKGQLSKTRVERRINNLYPDNKWIGDTIDAVGMGLYLKGVFK